MEWGVGGMLDLLIGSLVGLQGLLDEPLGIGRSMVRCVSGREFPVPDEVAAALHVFWGLLGGIVLWYVLPGGIVFWYAFPGGIVVWFTLCI